ncbi:hypothetical protein RCL1_000567 [Eukaryota sp. TZLM3-RCL]
MTTFVLDLLSSFLFSLEHPILCDFEITFSQTSFSCHRAVVSQSSRSLAKHIANNETSFDLDDNDEVSVDDVRFFLNSFYGQVVALTPLNSLQLFLLAKELGCAELVSACKKVLQTSTPSDFQIDMVKLLQGLVNDQFKDHKIVFSSVSIEIHKFLFASISPYFKTKFSRKWQESEENITDFTGLLKVEPSSFSSFFNSFYNGKLEVNLDNAFDYSHLSWYFQLSELEKFCNNYILESKAEYSWVTSSVLKAINCEDYRFIKIISTKISEISDLSNCDPIPVHPLFFQHLTANINVSWLLKCLVYSFSNYSEENIWTPQTLQLAAKKIKISLLNVDTLNHISTMVEQVKSETNNEQSTIAVLYLETLHLFAKRSRKQHIVLWIVKCLIKLWKSKSVSVQDFSKVLLSLNLDETRVELVHSLLLPLASDELLRNTTFEFISTSVVPRMISQHRKDLTPLRDGVAKLTDLLQEDCDFDVKRQSKCTALTRKMQHDLESMVTRISVKCRFVEPYLSTKNSNIRISSEGLVASNTTNEGWASSFVRVEHTTPSKLAFSSSNLHSKSQSFIGMFSVLHLNDRHLISSAFGLFIRNRFLQLRLKGDYADIPQPNGMLSDGDQIIVEFDCSHVIIYIPTLLYSYSMECPKGYVFGLALRGCDNSWTVDDVENH